MSVIDDLKSQLKGKGAKIVLPEGEDERVLGAANSLAKEGIVEPIVLGKREKVEKTAKNLGIDLSAFNFIDPEESITDEMVASLVERRKGKLNEEEARELLKNPNYFGTMMIYMENADGMVSGAVHTTGDTVRPALQIIKTKEGFKRVSGAFLMLRDSEKYLFADCAINIDIDSEGLAEVAELSDQTAKQFGIDAKIAMLSFSTKGSAKAEQADKVRIATEMVKENYPEIKIDGELQFDAAFDPVTAKKKAPDSEIAGHANVFIFPSLEAGNIGYKMAQRFGGFKAIGPILQGLNKPVNDLSRGCVEKEVEDLVIITAAQAYL